jgi:hypothetical protein
MRRTSATFTSVGTAAWNVHVALAETSADAYDLERAARRGHVFDVQPYLNPL